jgi:D-alanyl-D-alanine carboxypeptidase
MQKNGLCLEEYLEALKTYSIDDPYECSYDDAGYIVYYIASAGEKTPARVPLSGNYSISGNNSDGFIITTKK